MLIKSEMIRATGVLMNFLTVLDDELIKAGGCSSMLYFAQAKHAQPLMKLLAETIVSSKLWKIPKSFIMNEMIEKTSGIDEPDEMEYHQKWLWACSSDVVSQLTIYAFLHPDIDDMWRPPFERWNIIEGIPPELEKQLPDLNGPGPCNITWGDKQYLVTMVEKEIVKVGQEARIFAICLAPAEYFDLEG